MKKILVTTLILVMALLIALPALAQNPTEEAAATAQVTAEPTATATLEATRTLEPEATAVVIDINVDVTDGTGDTGSTGGTTGDSGGDVPSRGMDPNLVFIGVVLLSLIFGMADRFTNYRLSKDLGKSIPADWQPAIEMGLNTARRIVYERAGAFADSTESTFDNNLLDEDMKRAGWEFYIDPATGERHARKRPEPAPGEVAG